MTGRDAAVLHLGQEPLRLTGLRGDSRIEAPTRGRSRSRTLWILASVSLYVVAAAEPLPGGARLRRASAQLIVPSPSLGANGRVQQRVRRNHGSLRYGLPLVGRRCCTHGLATLMVDSKRSELLGDSL